MSNPTILLVDDSRTCRQTTSMLLEQMGLKCLTAASGREALEICRNAFPDLILMDVSMPEMDGLEATRRLREMLGDTWVPIIFLTGMQETQDIISGLKAGGDDYLGKPVHAELLKAKVRVFLRILQMQKQIAQDTARLAQYYQDNEFEQALALELIQRLTSSSFSDQPHVWHQLSPAANFSGDFICRNISPSGIEHFLLADCTGHGLTAAISALPVIDGFYELVRRYPSTELLASGINKKLHTLLPTGRFIASALCSVDYSAHTLSVWNGGIPCVTLFTRDGEIKETFPSRHPPLGILDTASFDASQTRRNWQSGDILVISSDGITEACNDQGQQFGNEGIRTAVKAGWPDRIGAHILESLDQHLKGHRAKDDVSLLVIRLG